MTMKSIIFKETLIGKIVSEHWDTEEVIKKSELIKGIDEMSTIDLEKYKYKNGKKVVTKTIKVIDVEKLKEMIK